MSTIQECWNSLEQRLQSIAVLKKQAFKASSPQTLGAKVKALVPPAVGIIYEGMRPQGEGDSGTKTGQSTLAVFGCYLIYPSVQYAPGIDIQTPILEVLEAMRKELLRTDSPTSHRWKFVSEAFMDSDATREVWIQRWQTPVILNPRS